MDLILSARDRATYEQLKKQRESAQVHPHDPGKRGVFFRPGYSPTASTAGADWKPGDTPSFALLRKISQRSVIDAMIIDARRRQMKKIGRRSVTPGKDVGLRVVHKRYDDPSFKPDDATKRLCTEIEEVLERVNPSVHQRRMKDVLAMWTEDELVVDRKAMIITRNRQGLPIYYHYVDGATVLPRLTVLYPWMVANSIYNEQHAATVLSYKYDIDLTKAAFIQEIDGQITAAWRDDQISVDIANPVGEIDHMLYGRSNLERSLELTRAFINAWRYNQNLFDVRYPDKVLILLGNYSTGEIEDFKNSITSGDVQNNQRMPVFSQPIDPTNPNQKFAETVDLRDTPREMQFPDLLRIVIAMKCGAYGMHPSTINFAPDGGGGTPVIDNQNAETEIQNAEEDGLGSLQDGFCDWMTETLVRPYHPDLKLIVDGIDQQGEQLRIELLSQRTWLSLDEVRSKDDTLPFTSANIDPAGQSKPGRPTSPDDQSPMVKGFGDKQITDGSGGSADPASGSSQGPSQGLALGPGQGSPGGGAPTGSPGGPPGAQDPSQDTNKQMLAAAEIAAKIPRDPGFLQILQLIQGASMQAQQMQQGGQGGPPPGPDGQPGDFGQEQDGEDDPDDKKWWNSQAMAAKQAGQQPGRAQPGPAGPPGGAPRGG